MHFSFRYLSSLIVAVMIFQLVSTEGHAETQPAEHYYNNPANINPDPNYAPGDYPVPNAFNAKTIYQVKKAALAQAADPIRSKSAVTLGVGEVTFKSIKNETAIVQGYFRNYFGSTTIAENGEVEKFTFLIDINSLDTAVPGRNYRILSIFFNSIQPDLGICTIEFTKFDKQAAAGDKPEMVTASGTIQLNGVTKPLSAKLAVEHKNDTCIVTSAHPITLSIADFQFGGRVYELMKECNHKSLGNNVDVSVKLYLR